MYELLFIVPLFYVFYVLCRMTAGPPTGQTQLGSVPGGLSLLIGDTSAQHQHAPITFSHQDRLELPEEPEEPDVLSVTPAPGPEQPEEPEQPDVPSDTPIPEPDRSAPRDPCTCYLQLSGVCDLCSPGYRLYYYMISSRPPPVKSLAPTFRSTGFGSCRVPVPLFDDSATLQTASSDGSSGAETAPSDNDSAPPVAPAPSTSSQPAAPSMDPTPTDRTQPAAPPANTTTPAPFLVAAASTASTAASYQVTAPSAPSNNSGAADTAALANSTSTLPTSTMVDNALPANEATNADATPANANSAGDSTLQENNTSTPPANSTVDNAASVHITGAAVKTSSTSNSSEPPGNDSVGCSTPVKRKRATDILSQQDIEEAFRWKEWRPGSFDPYPNSKRGRRRQLRRNASLFNNMAHVPTQQRAHNTLRKRVAALARHVGTNSGAVTGCLSGGRGRIEGDTVYIAAPQQAPTTFDAGATVPTQHTIAGNGAVSYWMLYGNFGPNWRPRGWLPGDKVPRGWLPGDKPPVARTQPATTSATTSTISGSRTVAPPTTISTIAGSRTVAPPTTTSTIAGSRPVAPSANTTTAARIQTTAPPANTSTIARTQPATASATTSTISGSRPVAPSANTTTAARIQTTAPPANTSTIARTQPATASATTSTIAGSRTVAPATTISTVAGPRTAAPPTTISTTAGSRTVAPPATTSTTARTQPQNNGPGQRALPRQDRKRSRKVGIEPIHDPHAHEEETYGEHESQELDDFKQKYLSLSKMYPPAKGYYSKLLCRRQRMGTRVATEDTLRVDRMYYALLRLTINRAVRSNNLDRLEELFITLLEASDENIVNQYTAMKKTGNIHEIRRVAHIGRTGAYTFHRPLLSPL
ncbi:hypothetical protein H4S04_007613 [Coemansia sp. S16]|nr:hypothetical protein H4S04_007613 [Coemansia sp. S16]